jgi:hypothetical protein
MPPRRWTTDELDTANKMLSDGASFVEIGKTIDRSAAAVEVKLKGESAPKTTAATKESATKTQTQVDAQLTESKAPVVEEKSVVIEPQSAEPNPSPRSDDDMQESSTIKYIVGAVIIAVVLYLILGR